MTAKTYTFTGTVESWTVPPSFGAATVHVQLWGASGGSYNGLPAGGGYVEGDLAVVAGDVLQFRVGGTPGTFGDASTALGGYNGGGAGNAAKLSGGGGGATDIRKNGSALANRVAVAAGAGGDSNNDNGGHGGALTGGDAGSATFGGKGGTQSAGGAAGSGGTGPGTLGTGGAGSLGAGGGGGYYGGGGGSASTLPAGGGGGSNYVGGLTGTITNTAGVDTVDPAVNGKIVLTYDLTPNAPLLTYPLSNFAYDQAQDFTVVFSDDDPTDTITAIEIHYRVGAGAWTTTGKVATTTPDHSFAAGTFAALSGQTVEWQARTWDTSDAVSAWSSSAFVTPYPTPAPFVFSPAPTLVVPNPVIGGHRSDSGQIAAYQMRVVNDVSGAPGSTILADTGVVSTSGTAISQALPDAAYVNGQYYHVLVRIAYPAGVWTAYTDSGSLLANIAGPLAPTFVATERPDLAATQLVITNPGSDPNPPDHNDVYRTEVATGVETLIATEVGLGATYYDDSVGLNRPYSYRVEAVTASGARTSSA